MTSRSVCCLSVNSLETKTPSIYDTNTSAVILLDSSSIIVMSFDSTLSKRSLSSFVRSYANVEIQAKQTMAIRNDVIGCVENICNMFSESVSPSLKKSSAHHTCPLSLCVKSKPSLSAELS